jgi:hypothetical protein
MPPRATKTKSIPKGKGNGWKLSTNNQISKVAVGKSVRIGKYSKHSSNSDKKPKAKKNVGVLEVDSPSESVELLESSVQSGSSESSGSESSLPRVCSEKLIALLQQYDNTMKMKSY